MIELLVALLLAAYSGPGPAPAAKPAATEAPRPASDLDRIAFAVEGAESSHGRDRLMWQPNLRGPQGPMQVTHAASLDVGGGDRFDPNDNRRLGRAYLATLFQRYGNWPDTIVAYNWGPANVDRWITAGRPTAALSGPIQAYAERILREFRDAKTLLALGSPPARVAVAPAPPQPPPPPEITDPALKRAVERNTQAIGQLRDFIAGDDRAEAAVRSAIRSVSARPGYAEFRRVRLSEPRAASAAALREIAQVMLRKLQAENAAIALVDQRRHGKLR